MEIIATIHNDFTSKFGIPRQSGLADIESVIIFEPKYRIAEAVRGIDSFSHLWLVWKFSQNANEDWHPTVRPPRLGGNTRVGVFASRSPFRPNPIGLSSVKLVAVEKTEKYGTILRVVGADLMDGTPIYDIKPYIPYSDCHTDATSGFSVDGDGYLLDVKCDDTLLSVLPKAKQNTLLKVLSYDPRPSYQNDNERIYGLSFADFNVRFIVEDNLLTVVSIDKQ